MRTLTIILLIFSLNCSAQIKEQDLTVNKYLTIERNYSTALKTIGLYTGSIILDAVGDGLMDSGNKEWGHFCNAASTGVLVMSPFVIDMKKEQWGWYAAGYILMRMAIYDIVYNLTRGLMWNYHGNTSEWDNMWSAFNPPGWAELYGRFMFFSMAFVIPLQQIK